MCLTLKTVIVALPFFVAEATPLAKQGGTAIPLFKSSSLVNADKSVNLEALKSHVASTRGKILRGLDNLERNTGASHLSVGKGALKRTVAGHNLNVGKGIWSGGIEVGTPPNVYFVQFDTASGHVFVVWYMCCEPHTELYYSDLFLPGPNCGVNCAGHNIYDPSLSESSVGLEKTFMIRFEDGDTVFGEQYNDTVTVSDFMAPDQTLGVALQYSLGLAPTRFPPDGVMGMAFQPVSRYPANPVFQTLVATGQMDEPVFSFSFKAASPELYLGGINPTMYTGDISYTPVTHQDFWRIRIDGIEGNGETLGLMDAFAIIDTGSELIHGPNEDVALFYDMIGGTDASHIIGEGYWLLPCNYIPSVSFVIAGQSFLISADNFNIGWKYDRSDCVGAIVGNAFDDNWLIGTAFLAGVYTVFDVGNLRVGFADLA
ncbi:Asp-domain-containing protein [Gyrodon lividus]|nr:Asp-domain-containing protein [Gyrodon lividus]